MSTFFVICGLILWGVVTLCMLFGAVGLIVDGLDSFGTSIPQALCGALLFLLTIGSAVGEGFVINSLVGSSPDLPDGCYRTYQSTEYMPMVVGKVTTIIPYDNTHFVPIACP